MDLTEALKERDPEKVRSLINQTCINAYIERGCAPLHLIANYDLSDENCREIFNLITRHPKIDINFQTGYNGKTILHLSESVEMVRQLVKIDTINLGVQDNKGNTPLMDHLMKLKFVLNNRISYYNNLYICIMLIKNGACVNLGNYEADAPILTLYKYTINSEIIDLFNAIIYHPECNVNQPNKNGDTILHLTETILLAKMLLNVDKVNVNALNREGMSPLVKNLFKLKQQQHLEQDLDVLEISKLLIEYGADVNLCDNEGNAPIHFMCNLDFDYASMKDFYNLLTNHPEINVNVKNIYGSSLLDLTQNPAMIREFVDLPWEPTFLISALKLNDEIILEKVFEKWDQTNYKQLIAKLMDCFCDDTFDYKNDGYIILSMWKYLYRHKDETREEIYEKFFNSVIIYYIYYRFYIVAVTLKEYEQFIEFYLKYAKKKFRARMVQATFLKFKDCKLLRTVIKNMDPADSTKFTITEDLFLYLITNFKCDLNETLRSLKPTYDSDYFFNLQHVSRYCTLPQHLFDNFKEVGYEFGAFNNAMQEIENVVFKPKSLLELSRNVARKILAHKYQVNSPVEMEPILKALELPGVIRQILMLEKPVHPQIPLPVLVFI